MQRLEVSGAVDIYIYIYIYVIRRLKVNADQLIVNSILSGFEVFDNIGGDRTGTVIFLTKVENLPPEIFLLTVDVMWSICDCERSV
jgi:hypothetical protein